MDLSNEKHYTRFEREMLSSAAHSTMAGGGGSFGPLTPGTPSSVAIGQGQGSPIDVQARRGAGAALELGSLSPAVAAAAESSEFTTLQVS